MRKITVRIPMVDFLGDLTLIEDKLNKAGITPDVRQRGMMKKWIDQHQDVAVFEYIPEEDIVPPQTTIHSHEPGKQCTEYCLTIPTRPQL